ncbi:unnamed protein product, partial [Allacma fusca]
SLQPAQKVYVARNDNADLDSWTSEHPGDTIHGVSPTSYCTSPYLLGPAIKSAIEQPVLRFLCNPGSPPEEHDLLDPSDQVRSCGKHKGCC